MSNSLEIASDTTFKNLSFGEVTLSESVKRIIEFIKKEPEYKYEIAVGTDSQTYNDTKFALAIVVHRLNTGAIFFCRTMHHEQFRKTELQKKLYAETQVSLDTAEVLLNEFAEQDFDITEMTDQIRFVIHVDIGNTGKTKAYISELTGWVNAQGFNCEIKPESYAASTVADRYSK